MYLSVTVFTWASLSSAVWSLHDVEKQGFSTLGGTFNACGDVASFPLTPLRRALGLVSSLLPPKEASPLRSRALADPGGYTPLGVSPFTPLRDEALLEEEDEDEDSDVRLLSKLRDVRLLSALRDLRHCSGSSLFLGPPLPLRWLLLNWLISCPTDKMESVSTEFGDLEGSCRPEQGALAGATSLCCPSGPSAGNGILGLFTLALRAVSGGRVAFSCPAWASDGMMRFRLLLSGS